MSEKKPEDQEPSIEEILNSIREIITDDEEPAAQEPAAESADDQDDQPSAPEEESEEIAVDMQDAVEDAVEEIDIDNFDAVVPDVEDDHGNEDVLDLVDVVEDEAPQSTEEELAPAAPEPATEPEGESILSEKASDATLEGFARLATNIALTRSGQGVTLEDIIKDMLRPMLHEWLDAHLPDLIERLVREELEKISRKAMDE